MRKILCVGNSITAGYEDHKPPQSKRFFPYATFLQRSLPGSRVDQIGCCGASAFELLNGTQKNWHGFVEVITGKKQIKICDQLQKQEYDLIIIMAGTNDLGYNF